MRDIKFRAFLNTGEMVRVHGIQFVGHSPRPEPEIIDEHNDVYLLDEVVLMQYTGLKDKNGTEIYEGDIVKFRSHPRPAYIGVVVYSTEFGRFHIEYFPDQFSKDRNDLSLQPFGNLNSIEIIGNIHEHPELLDG